MSNETRNPVADEFFDEELQGLGVNFSDETAPKQMPTMERKVCASPERKTSAPCAQYGTVFNRAPSFYDRLKGCAKWAVTFGALSCLIFYWQQTGLMAPAAAVPSMCACTCLAGFGVGKNALK